MQTNIPLPARRWGRQPATIPIGLMLEAENLAEDEFAGVIDFSLRGFGGSDHAHAGSGRAGYVHR